MASDRADRRQRASVVSNSDSLARATRLFRVLRLEHDPQPGLNGCTRARPWFLRAESCPAGIPPISGCPKRASAGPLKRRSVKRNGFWAARCSVPLGDRGSSGRRMPERGKSRFATVSSTYIRRGEGNGKRRSLRESTSWQARSRPLCDLNDGLTKPPLSVEWVKVRDAAGGIACRSASRWPHAGRRGGARRARSAQHSGSA